MNSEIKEQLEKLAYKRSKPFCYSCYEEAPTGCCANCGSDDLMRLVPEFGCEYGIDWVVKYILETELTAANIKEFFEQSIRDCYPETTKVGWCEFDTVTLLKEQDPIAWGCALSEYESNEESEGNIFSINGGANYYCMCEVEKLIEDNK